MRKMYDTRRGFAVSRKVWKDIYLETPCRYGKGPSTLAKRLAQLLSRPSLVVELGGGYGRDAVHLAKLGYHIVSFDLSKEAIRLGREFARDEDVEVQFEQGDVLGHINMKSGSSDAVFANLFFNFFTPGEAIRLLREIARVLKPNGILTFTLRSKEDDEFLKGRKLDSRISACGAFIQYFYDEIDVRDVFERCDFSISKLEHASEVVIINGTEAIADLWFVEMVKGKDAYHRMSNMGLV